MEKGSLPYDRSKIKFRKKSNRPYFGIMYSREEASRLRKNFWTRFGQYMRPLQSANNETVNWLNYKTGIKNLYFRMDVDDKMAGIAIELRHSDPGTQQHYFEKFRQLKQLFHETMGEEWTWELHQSDEDGKIVSRIVTQLHNVSVIEINDWAEIISFFKPRILALDAFWEMVKDGFE